jgi:hypothetical protein
MVNKVTGKSSDGMSSTSMTGTSSTPDLIPNNIPDVTSSYPPVPVPASEPVVNTMAEPYDVTNPNYNPPTNLSGYTPPINDASMSGGRRRKRGGTIVQPYNPGTIWMKSSPFPYAVGGKRTKHKRKHQKKTRRH